MSFRMRSFCTTRLLFRFITTNLLALLFSVVLVSASFGQEPMPQHAQAATPLADILREAQENNPQIQGARQGWKAAQQVPTQVSTLPDPQFQLQQVNVGSPRPFAGYTNSDFAYVGLGVSQDLPYPGKLRLRGEIAKKDADVRQQKYESVRRTILAEVKMAYFRLGYLARRQTILEGDGQLLQTVEQAAEARYRSGVGDQQDVPQAQVGRAKR